MNLNFRLYKNCFLRCSCNYSYITDKNGKKQSISHDGWEDNIMGASEKPVQQRNIDAILLPIFEQINNRNWFERLFQNNNIFHINKQDR